jgi:hypothetical protein
MNLDSYPIAIDSPANLQTVPKHREAFVSSARSLFPLFRRKPCIRLPAAKE